MRYCSLNIPLVLLIESIRASKYRRSAGFASRASPTNPGNRIMRFQTCFVVAPTRRLLSRQDNSIPALTSLAFHLSFLYCYMDRRTKGRKGRFQGLRPRGLNEIREFQVYSIGNEEFTSPT